jgi:lipoate-protein ligase A
VRHRLSVIRDSTAHDAALDTALSRAILLRVSDGSLPETFRLHVPGRVVAFGKRDTLSPGYPAAAAAAARLGFSGVERLAGGRAAVFHEGTLAFSWSIPDPSPASGIHDRFRRLSSLMVAAFTRLGVTAAVGELPGEYCPGEYSVHAGGRKVMGVGQRLARHAAHIGGVVVVSNGALVARALRPVYAALGIDWRPETAGSLQDTDPTLTLAAVADAILAELGREADLDPAVLDAETLELGRALAPDHASPTTAGTAHLAAGSNS